jgi:MoaA/NifB/PqqE/SkfB family radical SAM enzyme
MKKTVSFSRNSTNIFFHILTKCNLKCQHCYINPEQHGDKTLSIGTINAWLASFADKSKETNVIFLGGEPTLHPDLSQAVKEAKSLGYKSVTVDTNGYLFNNILSKVTPDDIDYLSFSLDGATPKTNDKIRGMGSYDQCLSGIGKAVSLGFSASLIYTISSLNIHELNQITPLLVDWGISRLFIQVIGIRGRAAQTGQEEISPKGLQVSQSEWIGTIPGVAEEIAAHGITVTYPKVYLNSRESFECAGLVANNYFIFPNGRVYRCPLCEDFPFHSMAFQGNTLLNTTRINEKDLFDLIIPEGCVMNKILQPSNLIYKPDGTPQYKIACCMLKEEISGT